MTERRPRGSGSVYQRPNGRWMAQVRIHGTRRFIRRRASTREEALALLATLPRTGPSDAERFWSKVQRGSGCWLWLEATDHNGYGRFRKGMKQVAAHRMALELAGVEIPEGMEACHRCDVRRCVRPSHLYVGTHQQNMDDYWSKVRASR